MPKTCLVIGALECVAPQNLQSMMLNVWQKRMTKIYTFAKLQANKNKADVSILFCQLRMRYIRKVIYNIVVIRFGELCFKFCKIIYKPATLCYLKWYLVHVVFSVFLFYVWWFVQYCRQLQIITIAFNITYYSIKSIIIKTVQYLMFNIIFEQEAGVYPAQKSTPDVTWPMIVHSWIDVCIRKKSKGIWA